MAVSAERIDFVRCPKCQAQMWRDLPGGSGYRWACGRCGKVITIAGCSRCGARAWKMTRGVSDAPGGAWRGRSGIESLAFGHRPYFRYQCGGCGRVIGILIDGAP